MQKQHHVVAGSFSTTSQRAVRDKAKQKQHGVSAACLTTVVMQVEGKKGFPALVKKVKVGGVPVLFHGALAASGATLVGHYPWFLTVCSTEDVSACRLSCHFCLYKAHPVVRLISYPKYRYRNPKTQTLPSVCYNSKQQQISDSKNQLHYSITGAVIILQGGSGQFDHLVARPTPCGAKPTSLAQQRSDVD